MAVTDITLRASDNTPVQCYLAGDALPGRPTIMLFAPIFGIDADAKAIADRWADRGYLVAVPDYFFRTRPGVLDRTDSGRKLAMERWKSLDVDQAIEDMRHVKADLLQRPSSNGAFGALGFCAGGELAFLAATRLGASAVAAFHATHIDRHLSESSKITGHVTLHYGGSDPLVPIAQVDAIRATFAGNPRVDINVYPGAAHGFSFRGQPSFHEIAANGSDLRAQEVLAGLKRGT